MGFHETRFPVEISFGARFGPGFNTAILETAGGQEETVSRWSSPRRRGDVGFGIRDYDDLAEVLSFFIARDGAANGFRFKDWSDFTTAANHQDAPSNLDVVLGVGDGSETQFQLVKKYVSGGVTKTRNLTKPVSGTVVVALDGVNQASGWTVDTTTGVVTFSSAPALDVVVTAGCEFDVPVRFGESVDKDGLQYQLDTFDAGSIDGIEIVEIRDALMVPEEFFYGGAQSVALTADQAITLEARVWELTPDQAGWSVALPASALLPPGGPYFYLVNGSGSYSVAVTTSLGVAVGTLAASGFAIVLLTDAGWTMLT